MLYVYFILSTTQLLIISRSNRLSKICHHIYLLNCKCLQYLQCSSLVIWHWGVLTYLARQWDNSHYIEIIEMIRGLCWVLLLYSSMIMNYKHYTYCPFVSLYYYFYSNVLIRVHILDFESFIIQKLFSFTVILHLIKPHVWMFRSSY